MKSNVKTLTLSLLLFLISAGIIGCSSKVHDDPVYHAPAGFEEFDTIFTDANHKVFANYGSYHGFSIKAMMIAYIDTINNQLDPSAAILIRHQSGWNLTLYCPMALLDLEDFRTFVNRAEKNDTIVTVEGDFEIKDHGDLFDIATVYRPLCFLDVNFDGRPALLVENPLRATRNCSYYDVYGFTDKEVHKVTFPPYDNFKTATNSWMLEPGTCIDYRKKEISIPYMTSGSCADHGTIIKECYTLDPSTQKFKYHQEKENYTCEEE